MDFLQKIFDNLNIKYDMNDLNKGLFNKYDITIKVNGKDRDNENCTYNCNCDTKCTHNNCSCNCDTKCTHNNCSCNHDECECDEPHYEDWDENVLEPVTTITMGNLDPIVANNAVTAESLRAYNELFDDVCCDEDDEDEVEEEPEVKLINVNKNVSKALETIYDVIQEVNDDGDNEVTFDLVDEFPELFKNVRDVTMEKVLKRISRHLTENGFNVETHNETNEYDNKIEKVYTVSVNW